MHNLPGAIFRSKDHRNPQSDWANILASAGLGLFPRQLHNISKLRVTYFTNVPWPGSFKRLLKQARLPEKTSSHDHSHTCTTPLLSKGVRPTLVQELLGHATISITIDT